jgi:hypothetical protein
MQTALVIVAFAGGLGAAWLCERQIEPWRLAAKAEGGPRYRRANIIAAWSIIGAFFAGLFATGFVLLLLG